LSEPSQLARALGRIPSGLFIVTTVHDGRPAGFLGSLVMQTSFDPPLLSLAVGRERPVLADLRSSGRFALSVLDERSRRSMRPFVRRLPDGGSPFDEIATRTTPSGLLVVEEALAWFECTVRSEHASGDHVLLLGEVVAGELLREGDPHVHLRKNGLAY